MVNNGDVHIEKPSDCLVAQCFSCSACVLTLGVLVLEENYIAIIIVIELSPSPRYMMIYI